MLQSAYYFFNLSWNHSLDGHGLCTERITPGPENGARL